MDNDSRVSIILVSSDHWTLEQFAEALLQQTIDLSDHEVIVVDCNGDPSIQKQISQAESLFKGAIAVNAFSLGRTPRATARNAAIAAASHDLLLFFGDDIIPGPTTIEQHIRFHQQHEEENKIAIGPAVFPDRLRDTSFRRWMDDTGTQFGAAFTKGPRGVRRNFFYVTNTSMKRSFQDRAGRYEERLCFDMTDDFEMGLRMEEIGMEVCYLPDAVGIHEHSVTLEERTETMKVAAHSARIFEAIFPERGKLYWHYFMPTMWYKFKAKLAHTIHRASGFDWPLHQYYSATLMHAFLNEYKRVGKHELPAHGEAIQKAA